jgi:predicted outer membrane lipoprotein
VIWLVGVLAVALVASNALWLRYMAARDQREWDERSELLTRVQQPELVTPRRAQEPVEEFPRPDIPQPDLDEMALAGTVQEREVSRDDEQRRVAA